MTHGRLVAGAGVFVVVAAFLTYIATLAPTITFDDSGELITACAGLGIPHPSGYPLFVQIGHLFTLVPGLRIATAVNLASAAAAAAACGVVYLLAYRLISPWSVSLWGRVVPAATAAFLFGFSRTFWSQAVITEVYALQVLLLGITLWLGFAWLANEDPRFGYGAAFTAGLALSAHTSSALLLSSFALYAVWRKRMRLRAGGLAPAAASLLLGASVFLFLPLRSAQEPSLNWGNPATLKLFYAHVTRAAYGGPVWERLTFLPHHWLELGRLWLWELSPLALALTAAGVGVALRARRRPFGYLAVMLVVAGPVATFFLVLLLHVHQIVEINIWYIPLYLFAAIISAAALARLSGGRAVGKIISAALGVAALAWAWGGNHPYVDRGDYYYAEDYASNFLRTIAFEGLNVMYERGSLGTYETAYLKKVEGKRPDHVFVDATATVYYDYKEFAYGRYNMATADDAAAWERDFEERFLKMSDAGTRKVYYAVAREQVLRAGYYLEPEGMLFRVAKKTFPRRVFSPAWGRYVNRGGGGKSFSPPAPRLAGDTWARTAVSVYYCMAAREYFLLGDDGKALAELERAAAWAHGLHETLGEIANVYLTNGYPRRAIGFYDMALTVFPRQGRGDPYFRNHYAQLMDNKAMAYLFLNDTAKAADVYRASLAAYPDQPEIRQMLKPENLAAAAAEFSTRAKER